MDYMSALALLNGRQSRKLENNTYLEVIDSANVADDIERIGVRLHSTYVVTFTPAWTELDSGGWHTKTTADRIDSYAPGRLSAAKPGWRWYAEPVNGDGVWDTGGYVYFDGLRILPDGSGLIESQPNAPVGIMAPILTQRGGW